jgi:hypothetical protein
VDSFVRDASSFPPSMTTATRRFVFRASILPKPHPQG